MMRTRLPRNSSIEVKVTACRISPVNSPGYSGIAGCQFVPFAQMSEP